MDIRLLDHGFKQQAELLKRSITERIPAEFGDQGMIIELCVNKIIEAEESYLITSEAEGWKITGSDEAGLYYGIGKFLHTAKWCAEAFEPNPPKKVMTPACSYRVIYFSVHCYNWYQMASVEELERYLEELLLWGYNGIHCIIPVLNLHSFDEDLFYHSVNVSRKLFTLAKKLGMKTSFGINPNQGLLSAPQEFDADRSFDPIGNVRGHAGRNLCPAKPGVLDYLKDIWAKMFEQYQDLGLDYIMFWPYDEGGCGCEQCRPWGAKGYADLCIEARKVAMQYYSDVKYVVSCWIFDKPDDQGEYEGLYQRLKGDLDWVDYIMVDAHADFPRYPLEHEVIKPVINFPEISMWKLFPWGGYGANPLPARFHKIWNSAKHILDGGQPYSEGMYEDISKIQFIGYYWEPDREWRDILAEYINYECSSEVIDDALEMIEKIERNHVIVADNQEPDFEAAKRCGELAKSIHERLDERGKNAWRWRMLYIRAVLDQKRMQYYQEHNMHGLMDLRELRYFAGDLLAEDEEAQELFKELRRLYHSVEYNGENQFTLPVVGGGGVFGNEGTREEFRCKYK